ncbi:hypothetical protein [Wolbachia endosymbiont (group A) of Ischnus inquisitorius]|uniref:hypothetical protein n=1 Tax=Wolbachia endosymbiont (group A) of Ischnus inquisitorius TaxID=3077922 RepID=UPI0031334C58
MFGPGFRDFVSQDTTSHGQSNPERLIKSWHGFEKPDSEDSGIEEEFEVLEVVRKLVNSSIFPL